jgi:dTDP-4-amino-4,6-dideoxygalactose transaminase
VVDPAVAYPRAWRAAATALSLPLDPRMREAEVWNVIHAVRGVLLDHRRPRPPRARG